MDRPSSHESNKTLNCESLATQTYWYTANGEYKLARLLSTPHIKSILGFMYKRANYKRQLAVEVMTGGVESFKTSYYLYIASMNIYTYCREHFPTYEILCSTLNARRITIPGTTVYDIPCDSPYNRQMNQTTFGENEAGMDNKKTKALKQIKLILDDALKGV